jgi:DNA-binding Lrp family transcriptional regulator
MDFSDLDRIDRALLDALQNDARLSYKELADIVGLAPSSVHGRVRRLLDDGAITGFHARVDPAALGVTLEAMIFVQVVRHARDVVGRLRDHVGELEEVVAIYDVAGAHDLLLHVAARDVEHLREIVHERLTSHDTVRHIETALIFEHDRPAALPNYVDGLHGTGGLN